MSGLRGRGSPSEGLRAGVVERGGRGRWGFQPNVPLQGLPPRGPLLRARVVRLHHAGCQNLRLHLLQPPPATSPTGSRRRQTGAGAEAAGVRASQTAACSAADLAPYRRPIDCALSLLAPGHHCGAKQRHPEQQIHLELSNSQACLHVRYMFPLSKQKAESRKQKAESRKQKAESRKQDNRQWCGQRTVSRGAWG